MLKLVKQKNDSGATDVVVKTDQGKLLVTKESERYINVGHFEKNSENNGPIEFRITQEDFIIYKMFFRLLKDINEDFELEKVTIYSAGFKQNEASTLIVDFDEESSDIIITLTKSLSKEWRNNYWVEIPQDYYGAFNNLYNELLAYEKDSNQISVFECFGIDDKQFVRTRSSN